jgi:hypothetical protein
MKNNYRYLFFVVIFQLFTTNIYAQKVTNISAEQVGQTIKISYTLASESVCNVSLYFSTDNGNRWNGPLKKVSGDIGADILYGSREIIWNVVDEVVNLVGADIKFKIIAESTSRRNSYEGNYELNSTGDNNNKAINSSIVPGKYPQASTRYLSSGDLLNLSKFELKIMRNEIFARHGYIFKTEEMKQYFQNQFWYKPRFSDVNDFLSKIEKVNISLIKDYE